MEQHYKYISENSLKELYLHDCDCSHLYFQDDRLIFEMEWMEVLASHPLNPYPQAHQSGPGRIELIHPEIIECSLTENGTAHDDWKDLQLSKVEELDFSDAEFRDCTETKNDKIYQAEMYLAFYERNAPYYAISIHIAYEKSIVMWDALNDVSWFEDEMQKK
ncbi:MAG: hypothetical protein K2L18_00850 [Acetatifactor sp.]|nr:hypothetical protein [Acetatifactor sp.]